MRQKQQLKFQRYLIVAGVLLLLCSFGLSLGSSVLSFILMNQLEIHDGAFTDREGRVLGSQPRNPSVSNVSRVESARRLSTENTSAAQFEGSPVSQLNLSVPIADFKEFIAKYESGATEFIVPVGDAIVTVHVLEIRVSDSGLSAHGTAASGDPWWVSCESGATDCSVQYFTIEQQQLHARAIAQPSRRLGFKYNG